MEFRYGLWTGVSAIYGEDERQLGEGNTRPLIFNRHVPTEVHACKYKGSRYGKLINISALRIAMKHFYEAAAITVAVRDYHMVRINRPITDIPGLWDQFVISRASLALIAYRYRTQKLSANERLPNDLASQYKLVTGVFVICREMANAAFPASKENNPVSAKDLYAYADDHHLFRSDGGMVCAGSVSKIVEFLELANLGRSHPESARLKLDGAHDHLVLLRSFVSDLEGWYRYALLTVEMDYFVEMEILRRKIEAGPEAKLRVQHVLDIYRLQYAYYLSLLGDRKETSSKNFAQGALERQNEILEVLKMPPVTTIPGRVIEARLSL